MAPLPSLAELERLLASTESKARRQLLAAFIRVKQGLPLSELERAIVAQNLDEAMKLIGMEPVLNALAQVRVLTDDVRQAGWFEGLRGLPNAILQRPLVQLSLGANAQQSPLVMEAIERQNLRRITAMTDETRAAIRETLTRGLADGRHPREVAREIRRVAGLNRNQAKAVANRRALLERQGRDPAQVDRMVDRFARRQLTLRAESIAITETMTALHQGKRAQWDRLQREGVIQGTQWETEFVTANDERVCPVCAPLDGSRAPVGQEAPVETPPLHPRCRCIRRLVLKGFRQGQPTSPVRQRILAGLR